MNTPSLTVSPGAAWQRWGRHGHMGALVVVMGLVTLWAMELPLGSWVIPRVHYLPLHTLMELASVFVALLVFATVWHTPGKEVSGSLALLTLALATSGWLDLLHALSFRDMPAFITPASPQKSIAFWLAARGLVALSLLALSVWPDVPPLRRAQRRAWLLASGGVVALVAWGVIAHENALPTLFVAGSGLTPVKVGAERAITAVLVLATWRLWRLSRAATRPVARESRPMLFGAAALLTYCEVFLTQYALSNDVQNMLGHLFKVAAYGLVYWGLLVVTVRRPYEDLATQAQDLQTANATLRTQALALDTTATPVIVGDAQGQVQWRNRASLAFLPPDTPTPQSGLSLFEPPITPDPQLAQAMRHRLAQAQPWTGLVPVKNHSGQPLLMRRVVTPILGAQGQLQGFVSVSEDVTESALAQQRHARVLETALDGFCVVGPGGRMLEVNAALAAMSGHTQAELLAMTVRDLEISTPEAVFAERVAHIHTTGRALVTTRHRHKDGHDYPVEISLTRNPDTDHFYAFVRDISERQNAEVSQRGLERQLQHSQKVQALGQLTGGIAHDFNNILAAIHGYANLALTRLVPDKESKLARYLKEVVGASERGRDLIAKLLTFTRTQADGEVQVIDPADTVKEVVAMLRPSIPPGVALTTHVDGAGQVCVSPGELNQVLVNLVINARDAIEGRGKIDIHLHRVAGESGVCAASHAPFAGDFLALDVSDSGSGIPPAAMPHLFEPFFTTKGVGKGTGLGLPMVHGILRRAGGFVTVTSAPGHGTRFRLLFPPVTTAPAPRPAPAQAPSGQPGAGQWVWVLDDQPAVGRFLAEWLAGEGYRVQTFDTPQRLLGALHTPGAQVHALVTDQSMPGMTGLELATQLQRLRPGLPVFLCSGFADGIDPAASRAAGVRQVFAKPVDTDALRGALSQALGTGTPY